MTKYTTTGNGEKIHLRFVRAINLENGIPKVVYLGRESSYAPIKTACGRYDNGHRTVSMMEFFELKKENKNLCQKCLARYKAVLIESRKLKNR